MAADGDIPVVTDGDITMAMDGAMWCGCIWT